MAIIINLDESVTDENLPKLGEIFFNVNINHNFSFGFLVNAGESITARIIGEGNFFSDISYSTPIGKTVTQTTPSLFLSAGTYRVGITSKYNVKAISGDLPMLVDQDAISLDCSQLKYSKNTFSLTSSHWKFENFNSENLQNCISINANGASGLNFDVAEFNTMNPNFTEVNLANTGCYGNAVTAFGNKINLTRLILANTSITGTYTAICNAMYGNGRVLGTMVISDSQGSGVKSVQFTDTGWSVVG